MGFTVQDMLDMKLFQKAWRQKNLQQLPVAEL